MQQRPSATVAQFVVDTQHGDPRYLEVARKVLADQRRVWGLDAPQKLDVRATEGPFDAMSDEVLPSSSVGEESLSPNHPDTSRYFQPILTLAPLWH